MTTARCRVIPNPPLSILKEYQPLAALTYATPSNSMSPKSCTFPQSIKAAAEGIFNPLKWRTLIALAISAVHSNSESSTEWTPSRKLIQKCRAVGSPDWTALATVRNPGSRQLRCAVGMCYMCISWRISTYSCNCSKAPTGESTKDYRKLGNSHR